MNDSENNFRSKATKLLEGLFVLLLAVMLGVSMYYNYTLEQQIYKRDVLIENLTRRDSILNQIFEIKYDSINKSISYKYQERDGKVVKYNELVDEIDEKESEIKEGEISIKKLKNDIFYAPGCMTPSEIIAAETMGASLVKLFPGNILGMEFMRAIKDLFPGLLFMPTGGVDITKQNIEGWFNAGVCAVGMGSKLISKDIMDNKKYELLIAETQKIMAIINDCKK